MMTDDLRRDFRRAYEKSGYEGDLRKKFHTLSSPGFQAVLGYRISRWLMERRIPMLGAVIQRMVEVWTGIPIPSEAKIGPGLLILHFGGIVINGNAQIGSDCTLHHGVTIGNRRSGGPSPKLGDRVFIGAGAKVLGALTVGDDVQIGANAGVLDSVRDGAVAVGIPAKVVRMKAGSEISVS